MPESEDQSPFQLTPIHCVTPGKYPPFLGLSFLILKKTRLDKIMFWSLPSDDSKSEEFQVEREAGDKCPKALTVCGGRGKKKARTDKKARAEHLKERACLVLIPRAGMGLSRHLVTICWMRILTSEDISSAGAAFNTGPEAPSHSALTSSAWQGDSCEQLQHFQPAWERPLPTTTSSQMLQKKTTPGMLLASQKPSYVCPHKVTN